MTVNECESLLIEMGVSVRKVSDDEIYCLCPFHKDNHTSLSVNASSELWICYRGCGGGALKTLAERLGKNIDRFERSKAFIKQDKVREDVVYERYELAVTGPGYKYLVGRGIPIDVIRDFELRWDGSSVLYPLRDMDGNITSLIRQRPGKKAINDKNMERSFLFGMYESISRGRDNPFVIVEGPIDLLSIYAAGFGGGATLGAYITDAQKSLIMSVYSNIILFPDRDAAGLKWAISLTDVLVKQCIFPKIVVPTKKDAGEMSSEEIADNIANAQTCVLRIGVSGL